MYRKMVFDNGLRVVLERMPALKSVTIGIWVNVGSRDERKGEEGLSHFIEHMFFKGTASRSAAQISREIDALGGEMNAFTGRETTTFYVKVLDQHVQPALALLSDLFYRSELNPKEIEKEKQVILEEVRMVQDDPEDLVQDLHTRQIMSRHPLGRPILGEIKTIRAVQREDLIRYIGAHYHPDETVLSVAGNFNVEELTRLLQRFFGPSMRPPRRRSDRWPPSVRGGLAVHEKSLEQAHLCLGLKGLPLDHKDRYAAFALNAVLGGSVSSRLFQEVREKRGLAYSIYSYASSFSDVGTLTVYAATRTREAPRVLEVICREVQRLRRNGVGRDELERARNQIKGNMMLGLESTQSRMSKLAKDELYLGRRLSLQEIMADIDRVTNEQTHRLGEELFDLDCLSVTGLGPISHRSLQSALP